MFDKDDEWTQFKFSNIKLKTTTDPDAALAGDLLINTSSNKIYIYDTVEKTFRHKLTDFSNQSKLDLEASFTACGNFIIAGKIKIPVCLKAE